METSGLIDWLINMLSSIIEIDNRHVEYCALNFSMKKASFYIFITGPRSRFEFTNQNMNPEFVQADSTVIDMS